MNNLDDYRQFIVKAEQKSQDDYDKTVLSLSGGALGISFAFIKDVIGPTSQIINPALLSLSWFCWTLSIGAVLSSFYFSQKALRRTILEIDERKTKELATPGGFFSKITTFLNFISGFFFLCGVLSMLFFVSYNL